MVIVLIRGLAREAAHWGDFPQILEDTIKQRTSRDITIITPDIIGCGKFHKQITPQKLELITDNLRDSIFNDNETKIKKSRLILIGLSMGGMIALDWNRRYSNEIKNICLINSSTANQPFFQRIKPAALSLFLTFFLFSRRENEKRVLKQVSNNLTPEIYHKNESLWMDILVKRPVKIISVINMLIAAAKFKPDLTSSCGNGLVIASTADKFVSYQCSEDIAKTLNWKLIYHNNAGHDLSLDDPKWLSEQLANWLATN